MTLVTDQQVEALERFQALAKHVQYLNYELRVRVSDRGELTLQGVYPDNDIYTGAVEVQHTRRWTLSPAMTDSEFVQTAFKLCLTSAEHRAREAFVYKGARVFGPHFDVEDLVQLCLKGREDAGGRVPLQPT